MASKLESDLQDTCVSTGTGIGLMISMLEKLLFDLGKSSFDWSNNTGATDVKIDVSVLEKKSSFKACVKYFLSNFYFSPNYSLSKTMKKI